ncbi:hypothetical protein AAE026_28595 [Bradyrhizobium sp. DN5]|uniref:hypothetical protein n=1 Tax=Bradyrhizobium sp. DN5 TaxID=3056950 RepID=UPI003523B4F6
MKPVRRSIALNKISELANRRTGASYYDAMAAAVDRLLALTQEYEATPPSYRGYLAVGICSCLESHIKYLYAAAAEGYDDHPEALRELFKDVQVDIDTLISTTTRTFGLADVVAANIKVSTFSAYRERASHLLSSFTGKPHDFPWDFVKVFVTGGSPELDKEYAKKLERLERVFDARNRFVHETDVLPQKDTDLSDSDLLKCAEDAISLMEQLERQYEEIGMNPRFAAIKEDENLAAAATRIEEEIDQSFAWIKSLCDERQYPSLERFRAAFSEYIWARCDFQTSVFISQRSEWTTSQFLDLAPEYQRLLREMGSKQKYMLSQHPISEQISEILGETTRPDS